MPSKSYQPTNYQAIELAIGTLITNTLGVPVFYGDFSKLVEQTPMCVIEHGELRSPLANRKPNFEDLEWHFLVHVFFDYTSDVEAHRLYTEYRTAIWNLFVQHRQLDDGNTSTYAPGIAGQTLDSKIIRSPLPMYILADGRDYVLSSYELWVLERLTVVYT